MDPEVAESLVGRFVQFMLHCPSTGNNTYSTLKGFIFAVDTQTGLAVLVQPAENTTSVINLMYVTEVCIEPIQADKATTMKYYCVPQSQLALPSADHASARRRLEQVNQDRCLPPPNMGCTIAAFEVFSALAKHFPVYRALQWGEQEGEIIIMDEIVVTGPFDGMTIPHVACLRPGIEEEKLARVRTILERWTKSRQEQLASVTPPNKGNAPLKK